MLKERLHRIAHMPAARAQTTKDGITIFVRKIPLDILSDEATLLNTQSLNHAKELLLKKRALELLFKLVLDIAENLLLL